HYLCDTPPQPDEAEGNPPPRTSELRSCAAAAQCRRDHRGGFCHEGMMPCNTCSTPPPSVRTCPFSRSPSGRGGVCSGLAWPQLSRCCSPSRCPKAKPAHFGSSPRARCGRPSLCTAFPPTLASSGRTRSPRPLPSSKPPCAPCCIKKPSG